MQTESPTNSPASPVSEPPPVLVCFAVEFEAGPFRRLAREIEGIEIYVTGMGARHARAGIAAALSARRPAAVLTCGFAGGLDPSLRVGDIVVSAPSSYPSFARLIELGAKPTVFHCASSVAATAVEKARLRAETNAAAVEMESGVIHAECQAEGVPCATVRVISDAANEDLPLDFNRFMTADSRMNYAKLALSVLASPGKIRPLLSFQRQTAACANQLGEFLHRALTVPRPAS